MIIDVKNKLEKLVTKHRAKEVMTCRTNCWCWEVDAACMALDQDELKEQGTETLIRELNKLRSALGADQVMVVLIGNTLEVTPIKTVGGMVAHKIVSFDTDALSGCGIPLIKAITLAFSDFMEVHDG